MLGLVLFIGLIVWAWRRWTRRRLTWWMRVVLGLAGTAYIFFS